MLTSALYVPEIISLGLKIINNRKGHFGHNMLFCKKNYTWNWKKLLSFSESAYVKTRRTVRPTVLQALKSVQHTVVLSLYSDQLSPTTSAVLKLRTLALKRCLLALEIWMVSVYDSDTITDVVQATIITTAFATLIVVMTVPSRLKSVQRLVLLRAGQEHWFLSLLSPITRQKVVSWSFWKPQYPTLQVRLE